MHCRVIKAFTPVCDGLCPAMTDFVSLKTKSALAPPNDDGNDYA